MRKSSKLKHLYEALEHASSFEDWLQCAHAIDTFTDAMRWRRSTLCDEYDYDIVLEHLQKLRGYRESGANRQLLQFLNETLFRLNYELTRPQCFTKALTGPKHLVERYFDEVELAIRYLCDVPDPEFPDELKLTLFHQALESFGGTALLLSGGATLGYHHLGVAKALWDQGLLPSVICGSSMGGIIAAAICTKTDDELDQWFEHAEGLDVYGLELTPIKEWAGTNGIFNPKILERALRNNIRNDTFQSAFQRTGRVLNISISPTRLNQKARVLNHQTAPDVLIVRACLASAAVPGLFPPVTLSQLHPTDGEIAYLPSETWIDGSIEGDLPKNRLSRLQNINHFIVSQTNPHVLPIINAKSGTTIRAKLVGAGTRFAQVQAGYLLDVLKGAAPTDWTKTLLKRARMFLSQDYEGDINIHPRFRLDLYRLMFSNPSYEQLKQFIYEGEKATWSRLALIEFQTRLARILNDCARRVQGRLPRG